MAKDEESSARLASIAAKALRDPGSLTKSEIQALGGSVLTQAPDNPKPAPKPKPKPPAKSKPAAPAKKR